MRLITKLKQESIEWLPLHSLLSKNICIMSRLSKMYPYLLLQLLCLLLSLRSYTPSIPKNFVPLWTYHTIKYYNIFILVVSLPECFVLCFSIFSNYLVNPSSRASSIVLSLTPSKTLLFGLLVTTLLWCMFIKISFHQLFGIEFHSLLSH